MRQMVDVPLANFIAVTKEFCEYELFTTLKAFFGQMLGPFLDDLVSKSLIKATNKGNIAC